MCSIFSFLKKIQNHYPKYIGSTNIRSLRAFIDGYLSCEMENCNTNEFEEFHKFEEYVLDIYNCQNSYNSATILLEVFNDDSIAIEKFFEHLNDYMNAYTCP